MVVLGGGVVVLGGGFEWRGSRVVVPVAMWLWSNVMVKDFLFSHFKIEGFGVMEEKRGETKSPIQISFKGMKSINSLFLSCNPLTKRPEVIHDTFNRLGKPRI